MRRLQVESAEGTASMMMGHIVAYIFRLVQLRVADDSQHDLEQEPHDYAQCKPEDDHRPRPPFLFSVASRQLSSSMQAWLLGAHIYPPVLTEFKKSSYSGTTRVGASTLSVGDKVSPNLV